MARQPFNTRWAQGVETEDSLNSFKAPGDVRLSMGWEGGQDKDAPPAGQENWWHNRVDTALQDLERRGAMSWHPQAVYASGAPCLASDGNYYESITNNNSGNTPISSQANWRLIGSSLYSSFSVGEYKDVAHNDVPDAGWLKCHGAVLLRAAYPRLFAKIGTTYNVGGELSTQFRLPDWRAMFPRVLDEGRGIDQGRALSNTPQASQNLAHAHSASSSNIGDHNHSASSAGAGGHAHDTAISRERITAAFVPSGGNAVFGDQESDGTNTFTSTPVGDHAHGIAVQPAGSHSHTISIGSNGGAEARSTNLAQVRWIRYL
jgi:microcystin-dependent protein